MKMRENDEAVAQSGNEMSCVLVQNDALQLIIGTGDRNTGKRNSRYPGIWSLTSVHYPFNVFNSAFSGLLPADMRNSPSRIEESGPTHCRLSCTTPKGGTVRMTYRLAEPDVVNFALEVTDVVDMRRTGCTHREIHIANYMNSPEDTSMYIVRNGELLEHNAHPGDGSTVFPAWENNTESWPNDTGSFFWTRSDATFDEPFFLGNLGQMRLSFSFLKKDKIRFYMHPQGSGNSLIPGRKSPAWDFYWTIPKEEYRPDKTYRFTGSMKFCKNPGMSDLQP